MSEVSDPGEFSRTIVDDDTTSTSIDRISDTTGQTGGAIGKSGATREGGTLTIVFSDIENASTRQSEMGVAKWQEVLNRHKTLVSEHVKSNRGRIVKNQDDGFMMSFESARQAIVASVAIQRDLEQQSDEKARIGIHIGEGLMDRQGEVFGPYVNLAARLASVAEGGQIVVSDLVKRVTADRGDLVFGEPAQAALKGIEAPAIVYELLWRKSLA